MFNHPKIVIPTKHNHIKPFARLCGKERKKFSIKLTSMVTGNAYF